MGVKEKERSWVFQSFVALCVESTENLLSGRELESVKAYFMLNVMQPSESINNFLLSCLHALEIKINCNKFMLLFLEGSGWAKHEPLQRSP